jgi:hypothetical protein
VGKAAVGGPPASNHHGSARGVPAEVLTAGGIEMAELLTRGGSRSNSGQFTGRGREGKA